MNAPLISVSQKAFWTLPNAYAPGFAKGRSAMNAAVARVFPIAPVVAAIMIVWYGFTVYLNARWQMAKYEKAGIEWQMKDLVRDTMALDRPILPAPHQIAIEIWQTTVEKKITSKRSLIYHGGITLA